MISFKQSGGDSGFSLAAPRDASVWEETKSAVIALLRARGHTPEVEILQGHEFGLFDAENGFGDEFQVLFAPLTIHQYVEMEERQRRENLGPAMRNIAQAINTIAKVFVRFVAFDIDAGSAPPRPIKAPTLLETSQAVQEALRDVETAICSGRPLSGVDRAHTALQGHLELICEKAGIAFNPMSEVTFLVQAIRKQHPAFNSGTAQEEHVQKALNGLAKVVDALSPLRNHGSIAHPNSNLLDTPEAMLMVNSVRTILSYIDSKISLIKS